MRNSASSPRPSSIASAAAFTSSASVRSRKGSKGRGAAAKGREPDDALFEVDVLPFERLELARAREQVDGEGDELPGPG
jgi:hypothetical protein